MLPFTRAMFIHGSNFQEHFWKESPKENSCEIISKFDYRFQRKWFFKRLLKNFFMSVKCKKPPFTKAMFINVSIFCQQFLKRITQGTFLWNYFKIGPGVLEKKIFLRISACPYRAKSLSPPPPPWRPCFSTDQNFANKLWKGSPKEQSCEIISKSDKRFQRRKFLKNFSKSIQWKKPPPGAAMFFDGSKFRKQFLKRVTQGTILWNYSKFWQAVSKTFE